nr:PepSY-like domain-containing protein [Flavobacterium sp.]
MKKFIAVVLLLVCFTATQAQKLATKAVPETVTTAFKKSHPTAINETWTKHDDTYEVKFLVNKKIKSLMYNTKGILVFNEVDVASNILPAAIKKYMAANYPNEPILNIAKRTTMTNVFSYAVEINDSNIIFDTKGNFIKSEPK